jgi:hypothetical protein
MNTPDVIILFVHVGPRANITVGLMYLLNVTQHLQVVTLRK